MVSKINALDLTGIVPAAPLRKAPIIKRAYYNGASVGRLNQDWPTLPTTPDQELRFNAKRLRARARDLVRNNAHAKRFVGLCKTNIVGPTGFKFLAKVRTNRGTLDGAMNDRIEESWGEWCYKENCTVDQRMDFVGVKQHVIKNWAQDGEVIIRLVPGYNNAFKFALQIIDPDQLDETYSTPARTGENQIRMGIEFNEWNKPVAYYILKHHPSDSAYASVPYLRERIPAEQIIHLYIPYRVNQSRGVTPFTAVMSDLNMQGGYRMAELVGARLAASKSGFIETDPATYEAEGEDGYKDEDKIMLDANPGVIEQLPPGTTFKPWDPTQPNANFAGFEKAILQSIAVGLEVAYVSLSGNLEGVSFSSIRSGELMSRDEWRLLQGWFASNFLREVYKAWLPMAELSGELRLDQRPMRKFMQVEWRGRGWTWVDPLKDAQANVLLINNGLATRQSVVGQQGEDIEETFEQLGEEEQMAEDHGIDLRKGDPALADPGKTPNSDTPEKPPEAEGDGEETPAQN